MTPNNSEKQLMWAILENYKRFQSMTAEEIYNSLGQDI